MLCGVDEAGKGAVLGPLVVAAVGCASQEEFAGTGVRDSKLLRPAVRDYIFEHLTASFPYRVLVIPAVEIDSARQRMTMNALMAVSHARVITELSPETAYVDACDVVASRYGFMVTEHLGCSCEVRAEHHADVHHPVVSAASIIAKVTRDRAMAALAGEYGAVGSGYPSDPETIEFLSAYIRENGDPPPCARKSWMTVKEILMRREQSSIADFF